MFKLKKKNKKITKQIKMEEVISRISSLSTKLDYMFEIMMKSDDQAEEICGLTKSLKNEKHKRELLETKLKDKENDMEVITKENNKLFEYLEKVAKIVAGVVTESQELTKQIKSLTKEIAELKTDRYKVVKIRPTKVKSEPMMIKSSSKTSKIITKVKEGK